MLDFLGNLTRTNYCGNLRASDANKDAVVMGWVAKRRDLGNLLFLDVRDRTGIVQVVFNKETQPEAHAQSRTRPQRIRRRRRRQSRRSAKKRIPISPAAKSKSSPPSCTFSTTRRRRRFRSKTTSTPREETRLRYRYLDLRRPRQHANLALRHKILLEIRKRHGRDGLPRNRNADAHALHARRRARLSRSQPRSPRPVLRAAAIAANLQTDSDDRRPRPLFPDRQMFPRRRSARRPPARIHAARPRDVVSRARKTFSM